MSSRKPLWWLGQRQPVARFTLYVAIATIGLVVVAGLQTCILGNQIKEARFERRPWVSADPRVIGGWDNRSDNGVPITIDFILKNSGQSPATNIQIDGKVIFSFKGLVGIQDKICEELRTRPIGKKGDGVTLFPGLNVTQRVGFTAQQTDIDEAKKFEVPIIAPQIIGCVSYYYPVGESRHETGFIYMLTKRTGLIAKDDKYVGPADLVLVAEPFGFRIN